MTLLTKRVYDPAAPTDGFRVLVDRLWPRGLTKDRAAVDLWAKDVAPSPGLRVRFHHEGMSWDDFRAAYLAELATSPAVASLRETLAQHEMATLLYGSHDREHNGALVLLDVLEG